MFERFSEKSRRAMFFGRYAAMQVRASVMQPEHLLEGVLEAAPASVSEAAATVELIRQRLSSAIHESPERPTLHEIIFSPSLKRVLNGAGAAADRLHHSAIVPEHLLLALLEEGGPAAQALQYAGIDRAVLEGRASRSSELAVADAPQVVLRPRSDADSGLAILHNLVIAAPTARVYQAVSTPSGLDRWWTRTCNGSADRGAVLHLGFDPGFDWEAVVVDAVPGRRFELEITKASADWMATHISFDLVERPNGTLVRFSHARWRTADDHFRTTSYCWALYLRLLKRYVEHDETVPFEARWN